MAKKHCEVYGAQMILYVLIWYIPLSFFYHQWDHKKPSLHKIHQMILAIILLGQEPLRLK